jgi:hypothetical protein
VRSETLAVLGLAGLLALPFLGKAFSIDDAVYLRIARHIREAPLEPYSFSYNWNLSPAPIWINDFNPPLHHYLLAALPHSPEALAHLAFLPFSLLCAGLSLAISRRLCRDPWPATLCVLFCPAYLIASTSVMTDLPLLAFWLAAVHLTLAAAEGREALLWGAGAAAAAAAMTKYFGLAAAPLLLAYWLMKKRRPSIHLAAFLLPFAALALWSWVSLRQAGFIHALGSAGVGLGVRRESPAVVLSFLGGSLLWPLFACPRALKRPSLLAALAAAAALGALYWPRVPPAARPCFLFMVPAGAMLCATALESALLRPDAESGMLILWFAGTVAFAGGLNWTVNARAFLPAALPAALLAARRMEGRKTRWPLVLLSTLAVSLLLACADQGFAWAQRRFARTTARDLLRSGSRVRFIGHWGFQHYMEAEGAEPFDYRNPDLRPGDLIAVSMNNTGVLPPPEGLGRRLKRVSVERIANPFGAQLQDNFGNSAGFYCSLFGPVPYSFARGLDYDAFVLERHD